MLYPSTIARFIFAVGISSLVWVPFGVLAQDSTVPAKAIPPYLDTSLPLERRSDDLVSRMTLEEKASQVVNEAAAIPRLKIPAYSWSTEALHGVAYRTATVFPEPIGLAATFDAPLIHEMGTIIAIEARAKHHEDVRQGNNLGVGLDFWAPNINIFRDPRWGRGQETYGEDPFLTARMAVAYISGMQGDDPNYLRVIATPKHFAVHSGPEPARHTMDVQVSKHDEEDTYLPAFRAAVTEGKAGSVMCVYNSVNGEPGCANSFLLQDQLRGKWKFHGYVVSDCGAVADIWRGHHYVNSLPEAAAISMTHGTDLECNIPGNHYSQYVDAVKLGLLPEKELDEAVNRLMRARLQLGMFDPPGMVPYAQIRFSENDSEAHRHLALKIALETMVLLKNDGVLPLRPTVKRIAVIGPLADQIDVLEGNYNPIPSRATTVLAGIQKQFAAAKILFVPATDLKALLITGVVVLMTGLLFGLAPVISILRTSPTPALVRASKTSKAGFPRLFGESLVVMQVALSLFLLGIGVLSIGYFSNSRVPGVQPISAAVAAAEQADVVIAVVGITSKQESEEKHTDLPGFKNGDRTSLDMPQPEENLIKALKATGKPLVVVLLNGSALAVNWASENANAILDAWYPGEEGGAAVAETLAGVNNPAGRLPITFYKGVEQLPPFEDYSMKNRTYRFFTGRPLFPFGFGLSYTTFAYSNLKLSATKLHAGDTLRVDAEVRNTGHSDGEEVTELYLEFPAVSGAPARALRGFMRVHLKVGETQHLQFALVPLDLSMVSEAGLRLVAPGAYQVSVGGGQPGEDANVQTTAFMIEGEFELPE